MIVKDINNEKQWEDFFISINKKTFLNSWAWGEFRKTVGDKIYRKGIYINNNLVAVFFISLIKARKGDFLLLSHNPLIKEHQDDLLLKILNETKKIAKKEKASYLRIAPLWQEESLENKFLDKNNFIKSCCSVYPEKSWQLVLNKNESQILSEMRKNTRYMIKKAEKNNSYTIIQSQKTSDIDIFYEIYKKTSLRNKFKPFSLNYIKKEFSIFSEKNQAELFLAKQDNKYVAGAIIIFWQDIAFYHHGASMNNKSSMSASYLVQWQAIKKARERNCKEYNFWVISPNNDPQHRWAGLTFFKKGFGGQEVNYSKTRDLPLSYRYWLTYFLERIRN